MNQSGKKLEPEPALCDNVNSSDPIDDVYDLVDTPNRRTRLAEPEGRISGNAFVAAGSPSPSMDFKLEEQTVAEIQPRSAQPDSGSDSDSRTVDEVIRMHLTSQEAFMEEYRNAASQERSQLTQAVHSEIQTSMNQIVSYIKSFVARSAQSSTPADVENLKIQLESEQTHVKDLKNNYNMLVHTASQQQKEIQKANAMLQDTLQEKDQLRKLLDGGSLANSSKATDDAIKSKWAEINYNIRCLAHVLDNAPLGQLLDDEVTQRLRFISKHYRKSLQEPELREVLLNGYLWVLIQGNVFNSEKDTWGGPGLKSYKTTRDSLIARIRGIDGHSEHELSIAHITRWLAQGSTMLSEMWEEDANAIKHMVRTEAKRLRPFTSDLQLRTDRTDKKISDQLRDIFNSAIELDRMMMCSRAVFLIEWRDLSQNPGSPQRWNPEVMEAEAWEQDPSQKSRVKLRLSPILYKFGTADGQNYDSRMVLAKSQVVCD
ncbi:uncharacterized protein B0J16DRAFT_390893 [Fusarium flagelliforme]|uniref:Uncharacterized protein n=1 Tax=Fusarium flagelliforme TaxID=2675880 RepID=A0A395MYQ0_9HYPO|nr:uncharacterized protein B0J16DRAFT_390893 [Fusarium flagelliforme]KAH7197019.1 hypothetical protein B0J16DRAFT_390893 [Fusarium flagelliforme]RFN53031.1 hypothetical protein FIE12Z_2614 [Fusarium flagelliforme]